MKSCFPTQLPSAPTPCGLPFCPQRRRVCWERALGLDRSSLHRAVFSPLAIVTLIHQQADQIWCTRQNILHLPRMAGIKFMPRSSISENVSTWLSSLALLGQYGSYSERDLGLFQENLVDALCYFPIQQLIKNHPQTCTSTFCFHYTLRFLLQLPVDFCLKKLSQHICMIAQAAVVKKKIA